MEFELQLSFYGRIKYYMCKKQFPKADAVICVSNAIRHEMIHEWHIDSKKVTAIENPYDISEINSLAEEEMGSEETAFYAEHQVIVAVGGIEKRKGYLYLVNSFYHLLSYQKDAGLVIIGEGRERKLIEERIKYLGIEKNVILPGVKKNPFPYPGRS